ncbi:MAG: phosphate ABC transporter permease subunit PstC, partial [Alphaproteobacteria bacterium]
MQTEMNTSENRQAGKAWGDALLRSMALFFGIGILAVFAAIIAALWHESLPSIQKFGFSFLTSTA